MTNRPERSRPSSSGRTGGQPAQQDELRAAAGGDQKARERLLSDNLHLVEDAVGVRTEQSLGASDLYQEGTIGLLRAIDGFSETGRDDFETYAREQIALHMDLAVAAEEASVKEARDLVKAAEAYEAAEQELRRLNKGTVPSDKEVAERLGWSEVRTVEVREMVVAARRRHDEELLAFVDPEELDPEELRRLIDERGSD
jgi:DNA-directed RNA polymerase specialized sigma subunit